MRTPGLPRDLYLTRICEGEGWRYSIGDLLGGQAVYGLTRPGYGVRVLSGGSAAIVSYQDEVERDISAAVAEGIIGIRDQYSQEALRLHFKLGMHNMMVGGMLFELMRRGEDPMDWREWIATTMGFDS